MDANRFDTLTRFLSNPSSRRGLWRGFTAATLGLAGAYLPGTVTARKKRKHKKRHKKRKTCTSGTESCLGQCVARCASGQVRNPITCGCCQVSGGSCSPAGSTADCCSGTCDPSAGTCVGRAAVEPCEFDAQCATGFCSPVGQCFFAAP